LVGWPPTSVIYKCSIPDSIKRGEEHQEEEEEEEEEYSFIKSLIERNETH